MNVRYYRNEQIELFFTQKCMKTFFLLTFTKTKRIKFVF